MTIQSIFRPLLATCVVTLLMLLAGHAHAQEPGKITIERPGEREFIKDLADIITPEDRKKIQEIADKLLKKNGTPIIVVTINSMADHNGAGMRIETFARLLFDQWGIGHAEIHGKPWNTGILLLVSKYDRRARIELGAGWKRDKDAQALEIMNERILPHFKDGDYSTGILAGVEALAAMAEGLALPAPPTKPRPWWHYALIVAFVGLAIFTVISLIRRGSSGWAWLMWAAIFGLIGYMLYQFLQSSRRSGGGGFSGGSFGGGFSGGGGASGSW